MFAPSAKSVVDQIAFMSPAMSSVPLVDSDLDFALLKTSLMPLRAVADAARWDHTSYGYMVIHVFVQKLFNFFTKFNKINIIISSRTAHRAQPKIQTPERAF